jgi:PAS domain S-box-containing protein
MTPKIKRLVNHVILLNLFLYFNIFAQEQDLTFRHITRNEGLSNDNIHAIYQDHHGFMWFGTENGLSRFDGYSIKCFFSDPGDSNSISDNFITSICEDNENNLWIGTRFGGLNKYDYTHEKFSHFKFEIQEEKSNWISSVIKCSAGGLWVGTREGLFRILPDNVNISWAASENILKFENTKFIHYLYKKGVQDGLHFSSVYCLCEDHAGNLWIGFDSGDKIDSLPHESEPGALQLLQPGEFHDYPPKFRRFIEFSHEAKVNFPRFLMNIYEDHKGFLWITSWVDGLFLFNPKDGTSRNISNIPNNALNSTNLYQITQDLHDNLWVCTYGNGLLKIPADQMYSTTPELILYKYNPNEPGSLSYNYTKSIFTGKNGILWIGTMGNGINKLNPFAPFENYKYDVNFPISSSVDKSTIIFEDKNTDLWFAENNFLLKYDHINNNFERFQLKSGGKESVTFNSLCEDEYGRMLLGSDKGLYRFDKTKKQFKDFLREIESPKYLEKQYIKVFRGSRTHLLTKKGCFFVERDQLTLRNFKIADRSMFFYENEFFLFEDSKHNLWKPVVFSGLYQMDSNYNLLLYIPMSIGTNSKYTIKGLHVYFITETHDGFIWIGTDAGLAKIDAGNKTVDQFFEKDGLPNDFVYGIYEDKNNILWISTKNGLSRFNPETRQFINFYAKDGLLDNEFKKFSSLKSSNGRIFIGSTKGINSFYPDSILLNKDTAPIVITDFKVMNKSVQVGMKLNDIIILKESINDTRQIELPYYMNIISFEFALLDYFEPWENQYAYKMEGIDPEWVYAKANKRYASYAGLSPGEYIFNIKAANNCGIWNEKGISIKIIILPPFWDTLWFRFIIIMTILSLIILIYKIRTNSIKKRNLQLEDMNFKLSNEINERERINKAYKALSDCNHALLHASSEPDLLKEICKIIKEDCSFQPVWIGLLKENEWKSEKPVIKKGYQFNVIHDSINFSIDNHLIWNNILDVINEKKPVITRNIFSNPDLMYLHDTALKNDFAATATFPIIIDNRIYGVLNVFSNKVNTFDIKEIELLLELTNDLAFGILTLHTKDFNKKAEKSIRKNSEEIFDLYNNAPCGYHSLNKKGVFLRINDTELKWLGYEREEIIGTKKFIDILSPESVKIINDYSLNSGNPDGLKDIELEVIRKDNTSMWVLLNETVIIDVNNNYLMSRSTLYDITERKFSEEALKIQKLLFQQLFKNTVSGILLLDNKYNIIDVNNSYQNIFQYSSSEIIGQNFMELIMPDKLTEELEYLSKLSQNRGVFQREICRKRRDGEELFLDFIGIPILIEDALAGVYIVYFDNTEHKKLEQQLRQSQKMEALGTLAGGIAHDFNNLLTIISGSASLLKRKIAEPEALKNHVENILSAANKASTLTGGLLAFSRKDIINLKPIKINEVIRHFEKLLMRFIGEDIRMELLLSDHDMTVMADNSQLEQVILNLVINARDAMPNGGKLTISTNPFYPDTEFLKTYTSLDSTEYVQIFISDNGIGIDEKILQRIFEPFFTTKEVGKGTGLGLSMVYGIIKQHSGDIFVESKINHGTTFKIYLPMVAPENESSKKSENLLLTGGTEVILLAEDDEMVRNLERNILEDSGYVVIEAENGEDAIHKFMENKDKVQLLLFDVIMPKMNGKDAYMEIKKISSNIKIIFTSGYTSDIISRKGIINEGLNFISKPVTPDVILQKIREVLDNNV